MVLNSKFLPIDFGSQKPGRWPSGVKIAPKRVIGFAAAVSAGDHRFEQRQAERGAHAAEHHSPGQLHL